MTNSLTPRSTDMFLRQPEDTAPVDTSFRRIQTALPAPETAALIAATAELFPQVNCYQPPILWDRAEGFQVYDSAGNCWIDFSSTAVMTNTGHGHPAIRRALAEHVDHGLLAQFSYASSIRIQLAQRLLSIAPQHCDKVYFWTTGSETTECALRLVREWGARQDPRKDQILTHAGDYHGWTLGAQYVSGDTVSKPWLSATDETIHHLPAPGRAPHTGTDEDTDWAAFFDASIAELAERGVQPQRVAGVFIEAIPGARARPWPMAYMQRLREWADQHQVLLIFDEIQTGFGRTGSWFAHEHYGVRADLICIGKGVTSSLPLAAILGPAAVLDLLGPAAIATTHAGHPLSCAAALANLETLESENLIAESTRKGQIAAQHLRDLQQRFPQLVADVNGIGLFHALQIRNPHSGQPDRELASACTWEAVKRGVIMIHTGIPMLKIAPPLVIPDEALIEGIAVVGEAIATVLDSA